jgi:hypothetical protein
MTGGQEYYDGLITQGFTPDQSKQYTEQHFPGFAATAPPVLPINAFEVDQQEVAEIAETHGVDADALADTARHFDANQDFILQPSEVEIAAQAMTNTVEPQPPMAAPMGVPAMAAPMGVPAMAAPMPAPMGVPAMAAPMAAPMGVPPMPAPMGTLPMPGMMQTVPMVPVVIGTVGVTAGKPAISLASGLSIFKYGFFALVGWIASMILLGIVWAMAFFIAFDVGGFVALTIIIVAVLVSIIAYGQMIIYPVGKALKDGRTDGVSFSYVDSWKTSVAGFVESVIVTTVLALLIAIGVSYEINELLIVGVIGFFFFAMGYIPYMVRKTAEIMR